MDIDYLLFLQNFRNSINNALTPFMEWISHFAEYYLLVIPVFIYWCIDKKKGIYTLASVSLCVALNSVIKLTACVYRPWIKDSRVLPAGNAITESTGYSFPSGHTTTAAPIYGGIAVKFGRKRRWIAGICVALILVTAFSRNYLGVHTPQDVLVGLLLSAATLFAVHKIFAFLQNIPDKEYLFLTAGMVFGVAALLYIKLKSYPMDYVNGELLVDPQKMMKDGFKDIGMLIGFCGGRLFEKRFVRFTFAGLTAKGIIISLVGGGPLLLISTMFNAPLVSVFGSHIGSMLSQMILMIYIIVIWPAVIRLICGKSKEPISETESVPADTE